MKSKGRKQIEQMIVRGHQVGICDSYGNSVTMPDGRFVAKPKVHGVVTLHKVYPRVTIARKPRPVFKDYRD
ncbi:MAG: hypothetical protein GY941_21695 [Planctomycetes bacterium]|nr:hypothetical protein [Planctomycetota bacterium]